MYNNSDSTSFLIILFQFLQYYVLVVLSGDAFDLFHRHFYCDSFTRDENCIQNIHLAIIGRLLCLNSGPDFIANLSDGSR